MFLATSTSGKKNSQLSLPKIMGETKALLSREILQGIKITGTAYMYMYVVLTIGKLNIHCTHSEIIHEIGAKAAWSKVCAQ